MDYETYRGSDKEQGRTSDILSLAPQAGGSALDVGARDGWFSRLLAERYDQVTALDLAAPVIDHPRVTCVAGDMRDLRFTDNTFDLVFCAEVLEHIPPADLALACSELVRVARGHVLIGVPYKQDLRLDRTTCQNCGTVNPPWGHVNRFDKKRLLELFPSCRAEEVSFSGEEKACTNALAAWLMDLAGNPYGTYGQEEPCIRCGQKLVKPQEFSLAQRGFAKTSVKLMNLQGRLFCQPHPIWIHIRFAK